MSCGTSGSSNEAVATRQSGHSLPLTGERTLPGVEHENYWFRRHEAAYREVAALAIRAGFRTVLDAGCGEGYGAAMLARAVPEVAAVDLDAPSITYAAWAYPSVRAVRANLVDLPFASGCLDAVVSLQVIEHQWDVGAYLDEIARVLRPGGAFLCTTPNRLTFSPGCAVPVNPFHTVEFTASELASWLGTWFHVDAVGGLWHGARLAAWEARMDASLPSRLRHEPWPNWLATLVADVAADDFTVSWPADLGELDRCLDLFAIGWQR